jgi:hypothetical protein
MFQDCFEAYAAWQPPLFDGDAGRAIASLPHGLTLNPYDSQNVAWPIFLAYAELRSDMVDDALESAKRALALRPVFGPTFELPCCCTMALGRGDDGRRWAERVEEVHGPEGRFVAPIRAGRLGYDNASQPREPICPTLAHQRSRAHLVKVRSGGQITWLDPIQDFLDEICAPAPYSIKLSSIGDNCPEMHALALSPRAEVICRWLFARERLLRWLRRVERRSLHFLAECGAGRQR